ncbi:MAG: PAS domain S-box protein [Gammaproteobacteria bacterium]|nr:PAS domain S-box protein [Gammaproteobacteria bacterium]
MLADKLDEPDWIYNQEILNAYPTGVVICNENMQILSCNDEITALFGYDTHSLINKPVHMLLPEQYQLNHKHHVETFKSNPTKRNMGSGRELFARRQDGQLFPVEIGLNPIFFNSKLLILATIADISKRYITTDNFKTIVEAAPIGMLIINEDGTIRHCNKHLLTIFGYSLDETLNQTIEMLLPERHRGQHIVYRNLFMANPSNRAMGLDRDLTALHKNGSEFPVEIGLSPIETEQGRVVVAAVSDITERNKVQLKLKQANADLDEFTYVASHDLKSPLQGISSLIEWIEEDLEDNISDSVRKNLERAHVRIERMEKLIDDLLTYARSGRKNDKIDTVNINETIDDMIQFLGTPDEFNITVESNVEFIKTYTTPLQTVLRNLISNAIKHHHKRHGTINIKVTTDNAYCIFDVIDDGPGIPLGAQERVFKLFQSLSPDSKARSGIGLAVCRRLVDAHGGKIEIIPNPTGTCFRFWWPRIARRDLDVQ